MRGDRNTGWVLRRERHARRRACRKVAGVSGDRSASGDAFERDGERVRIVDLQNDVAGSTRDERRAGSSDRSDDRYRHYSGGCLAGPVTARAEERRGGGDAHETCAKRGDCRGGATHPATDPHTLGRDSLRTLAIYVYRQRLRGERAGEQR